MRDSGDPDLYETVSDDALGSQVLPGYDRQEEFAGREAAETEDAAKPRAGLHCQVRGLPRQRALLVLDAQEWKGCAEAQIERN